MNRDVLSVLSEQNMAKPGGSIPRFFAPRLDDPTVTLEPGESAHALRVLRLTLGDTIELFDGQGRQVQATITATDRKTVTCQFNLDAIRHEPEPDTEIVIAAPAPKADAAAVMVDMLSQVGAARWIPMQTQRSVVDPGDKKIEKWRRLVIESAKQCGRLHLMHIHKPTPFAELLQHPASHRRILLPPTSREKPRSKHEQTQTRMAGKQVLLLIGPEGGFSHDEITAANQAGFIPWAIPTNVMRIETAAVAAATLAITRTRTPHATLEP